MGASKLGDVAGNAQSGAKVQQSTNSKPPQTSGSWTKQNQTPVSVSSETTSFNLKAWVQASVARLALAGYIVQGSGVTFKNLSVYGAGVTVTVQETVASALTFPFRRLIHPNHNQKKRLTILSNFEGVLNSGELLAVLGRPGSGCSTFLKSISGDLNRLTLDTGSIITYNGK
jgi:ATP-binding cassette subfamily G (WHITE) protein 2 (PDR)